MSIAELQRHLEAWRRGATINLREAKPSQGGAFLRVGEVRALDRKSGLIAVWYAYPYNHWTKCT